MHLRIADVVIDTDTRQVLRNGREVALSPKAFQLLSLLAASRPKALSKDDLHRALWPDTFVVEANLSNLVGEIRAALDDSARDPRFIRTVHGYGYAFCGDSRSPQDDAGAPAFFLISAAGELPLRAGENIVGRSPDAHVRLTVSGVSRRHARIVVEGGQVFVEDLGSKNGTYVQNDRISGRRRLDPQDEIAFGAARLRLRVIGPADVTDTI